MNLLGDLNEDTLQNATFQKNCIISKHSNSIQLANAKSTILRPVHTKENECESKKDQRAIGREQRKKFNHQRNFLLSCSLSLGVSGPLAQVYISMHANSYSIKRKLFLRWKQNH